MIQFNKFIDGTNLEHVGFSLLFAAVLGAVIWLLTGDLGTGIAVGCGFGAGFFVGREHDQAEYRWIETLGRGSGPTCLGGAASTAASGASSTAGWTGSSRPSPAPPCSGSA